MKDIIAILSISAIFFGMFLMIKSVILHNQRELKLIEDLKKKSLELKTKEEIIAFKDELMKSYQNIYNNTYRNELYILEIYVRGLYNQYETNESESK